MVTKGLKAKLTEKVTMENVASKYGNKGVDVYATPVLIALMEKTSIEAIKDHLEEGQGTVGTAINMKHMAATPVGMTVTVESELVEVDRNRLVFNIKAYDEFDTVSEATHERFLVVQDKFLSKIQEKANKVK